MSAAASPGFPRFYPIVDALVPRSDSKAVARLTDAALVVAGTLLVAACARLVIPLPLVPITGQTFGVLLVGMLLGPRRGAISLLLYLLEGAAGLPVFHAGTSGIARLIGPTAGYLWSYPFAAFLIGALAERGWDRSSLRTVFAMLLGVLVILTMGTLWLSHYTGDLRLAFMSGFAPFVPGELIKTAFVAALLPGGWKVLNSRKRP